MELIKISKKVNLWIDSDEIRIKEGVTEIRDDVYDVILRLDDASFVLYMRMLANKRLFPHVSKAHIKERKAYWLEHRHIYRGLTYLKEMGLLRICKRNGRNYYNVYSPIIKEKSKNKLVLPEKEM